MVRRIMGENRAYSSENVPLLPQGTSTVSVEWVDKKRNGGDERHRLCTHGIRIRLVRLMSMTQIKECDFYVCKHIGRKMGKIW